MTKNNNAFSLAGKKGLILGLANENSIAWGCTQLAHQMGAELVVSCLNDKARRFVEPLTGPLGVDLVGCNVEEDGELVAVRVRVVLQDIDDGLKELGLLAHQRQLLLELLDALFGRLVVGVRHGDAPAGAHRSPLAPILPTMFTQPYQNGGAALNAITGLSLFVGELAFFNLLDQCQFKSQRVIALCPFHTLSHRVLH